MKNVLTINNPTSVFSGAEARAPPSWSPLDLILILQNVYFHYTQFCHLKIIPDVSLWGKSSVTGLWKAECHGALNELGSAFSGWWASIILVSISSSVEMEVITNLPYFPPKMMMLMIMMMMIILFSNTNSHSIAQVVLEFVPSAPVSSARIASVRHHTGLLMDY